VYLKVKQAISSIKYGASWIRIITVTVSTIIMPGGPIDIAPLTSPDILSVNFHEYPIGNHGASRAAPVVIRGINELNIVIIWPAIDEDKGCVVLKDVISCVCPG